MEKTDKQLLDALETTQPGEEIRVILQATPEPRPVDAKAWESWVEAYLHDTAESSGTDPCKYQTMPNLRTIVATAPGAVVRKWIEAPETKSIRLQPPDESVEFFKPVKVIHGPRGSSE